MSSRYFSEFKEKKISSPGGYRQRGNGSIPAMREKPAFPGAGLPGKAQKGGRNLGITKCKIYPKSEGL